MNSESIQLEQDVKGYRQDISNDQSRYHYLGMMINLIEREGDNDKFDREREMMINLIQRGDDDYEYDIEREDDDYKYDIESG